VPHVCASITALQWLCTAGNFSNHARRHSIGARLRPDETYIYADGKLPAISGRVGGHSSRGVRVRVLVTHSGHGSCE